jgi:hypothetical protein
LDNDVPAAAFDPAATDHFFLRRIYLTLRASLGHGWGALMTYDFANGGYDDAVIEWQATKDLRFDFGLRKVNSAYEERRTSGDIRAIERSGITRYFIESNNGRRLSAAGHHIGAFLEGNRELSKTLDFHYGAAITNPERTENFTVAAGAGDGATNQFALWSDIALTKKFKGGSWRVGAGYGHVPDQGGVGAANFGRGFDINLYSAHTELASGPFTLIAEYLTAEVEAGRVAGGDARPRGFFVQPMFLLRDGVEAVVRYQWLDTDGRGVTLSDVIRSAPTSGTMDHFTEWYAGVNWYLRGNDLKLQLGGIYGETKDTVSGAPAKARTTGARSQMQLQF